MLDKPCTIESVNTIAEYFLLKTAVNQTHVSNKWFEKPLFLTITNI